MILQKWNGMKHTYEDYEIPSDWICKTYSNDMDEIVNCPHCGKELRFGETYTSKEIHTAIGFGYGVCHDCYEQEWARKEEVERMENKPLGEKLLTIISHYGVIPQLKYLQTEIFEFNEAVIKHEDDIYYMAEPQDIQTSKEHIEEEFADVMVMLEQFKVFYELDNEKIIEIMKSKIDRQMERIQNENNKQD